jgi:hypothetical protein
LSAPPGLSTLPELAAARFGFIRSTDFATQAIHGLLAQRRQAMDRRVNATAH